MAERSERKLRVLWATDGSPHTADAIPLLREFVLPVADQVTVLTVAPHAILSAARPDPAFLTKVTRTARARALAEARRTSEQEATALSPPPGIEIDATSRWGHAIEEILKASNSLRANLIVMAAKGHSSLRIIVVGSVAQGVVQHATRPVLIARGAAKNVDRIILGYHGSAAARKAVRFLGELAVPQGAEFILVNVIEPFTVPEGTPPAYKKRAIEEAQKINARRHRDAERGLEAAAKLLSAGGRSVTTKVLTGSPDYELDELAEKENADLIVVGSRKPSAERHYLLGSTAEKLVRHAHTSVLIVR